MSIPSSSNYQIFYNANIDVEGDENFEPPTSKRGEYQQMVAELANEDELEQWIQAEDTWTL